VRVARANVGEFLGDVQSAAPTSFGEVVTGTLGLGFDGP
jgi:hypothetical protein